MNILLSKLKEYGADVEGAMERFVDDEDLYVMCFTTFLEDDAFDGIVSSVEKKEYMAAFEYAHSIKGVAGNLGLQPLYYKVSDLVEQLRNSEFDELDKFCSAVIQSFEDIKAFKQYL